MRCEVNGSFLRAFFCADMMLVIPQGLGRHIQALGPNAEDELWLGWFIGEATYTGIIIFVKFSVLALYYRTFAPLNIKREIVIMSVVTFLWGASVVWLLLNSRNSSSY